MRVETADGLSQLWAVNLLAPMCRPRRCAARSGWSIGVPICTARSTARWPICNGATGDPAAGVVTQAWPAGSDDAGAQVTSGYFHPHQRPARLHPRARHAALQDRLIARYAAIGGIDLS